MRIASNVSVANGNGIQDLKVLACKKTGWNQIVFKA